MFFKEFHGIPGIPLRTVVQGMMFDFDYYHCQYAQTFSGIPLRTFVQGMIFDFDCYHCHRTIILPSLWELMFERWNMWYMWVISYMGWLINMRKFRCLWFSCWSWKFVTIIELVFQNRIAFLTKACAPSRSALNVHDLDRCFRLCLRSLIVFYHCVFWSWWYYR